MENGAVTAVRAEEGVVSESEEAVRIGREKN